MAITVTARPPLPSDPPTQAFHARYSGATQRARILDAVMRVVAQHGYNGATVSSIVSTAGVSRSTFYEHFDGKKDCLLEAYTAATEIVVDAVAEAALEAAPDGWEAALSAGLRAYFDLVRTEPITASIAFVQLRALGEEGIEASAAAGARHVDSIIELVQSLGIEPGPSRRTVELVIAGIDARVGQAFQLGGPDTVDDIEAAALETLHALMSSRSQVARHPRGARDVPQ